MSAVRPPPPRAVIFDWDGTLIDNWRSVAEAMNAALAAFHMPTLSVEEVRRRARYSMRESFPDIFGPEWPRARDIFVDAFARVHLQTLERLPGAEALLEGLETRGATLAIVSNKSGDALRREVEALGWSGRFHRIVGAGDAARDKPAVDPVTLALLGCDVAPGRDVWFVGDSAVDIACARAAGCVAVLVNAIEGERAAADHTLLRLADVASLAGLA